MHALQDQYNVFVIQDACGNLELDAPANMPDDLHSELVKKVGVLDRLCLTRIDDINLELDKAKGIENRIKTINPTYTSSISGQIAEFARLRGAFR